MVCGLDDILTASVNGSGCNERFGLLGSNKATEESVKLFASMVEAADEVTRQAGINRTRKTQFVQPVEELLQLTHTFLVGCENPDTIDTEEKQRQFDSFLMDQVKHRMVLLRRIRGITAEEYRDLNRVYAKEMEAEEQKEQEERRTRGRKKES